MSKVRIYKIESYKINSLEGPIISWDPFTNNKDSHSKIKAFTIKSQDEMLAVTSFLKKKYREVPTRAVKYRVTVLQLLVTSTYYAYVSTVDIKTNTAA